MKKWTKADVLWLTAFLLGAALLLYKARFGFAVLDEAFYLAIPYRFIQGDALCLDEWNLSQLSSLLLCPLVWAYTKVFPTTEGMILVFRYVYAMVHSGVAVFVYVMLRRKSWSAGFASILYLLFTPFAIRALSYNTMGIGLMVISSLLLYCNEEGKKGKSFGAGLAFAGAVLCCPHLVALYVVYGIACGADTLRNGKNALLSLRDYGWFTAGCAVAAAAVFWFMFSRCTLAQLLEALPQIFYDPDHVTLTVPQMFYSYFWHLTRHTNEKFLFTFWGTVFVIVLICLDKKREGNKALYLAVAVFLTAVFAVPFVIWDGTSSMYSWEMVSNLLMFPMAVLGVISCFLMPKELRREMVFLWFPGILYGFCINLSSNQGFGAISDAATVTTLGSIIMAGRVCSSISGGKLKKAAAWGMTVSLLSAFVLCMGAMRYHALFYEYGSMAEMTYEIQEGSHKGIFTSKEYAQMYASEYERTEKVREHPGEKVLYYSRHIWHYLNDTKRTGSYSAWLGLIDQETARKMMAYYELNPAKIPDVAYFEKQYWPEGQELERFLKENFTLEETEYGYILTR